MADAVTQQQTADPLPYIAIFAVLTLITLGVLTWVLDVWFKEHQCNLNPNIWCSDNWTCNTSCPTGAGFNSCFTNPGSTGLASCLFGPTAAGAMYCSGSSSGTGAVICPCPAGMTGQLNNCFSGCPQNLGDVNPSTSCCCCPGAQGCPASSGVGCGGTCGGA